MPAENAFYLVRVYGVVTKENKPRDTPGEPIVLVIVLNDPKERESAGLAAASSVQLVTLPGGDILTTDSSLLGGLERMVKEQTGCRATTGKTVGPFEHNFRPTRTLTFGSRVELDMKSQSTGQKLTFRWVTLAELESETRVRFPGLGKQSSMFKIATAFLKPATQRKPAHETGELIFKK